MNEEYKRYMLIDNPPNISKEDCRRVIEKSKENTRVIFIGHDAEQEIIHKKNKS